MNTVNVLKRVLENMDWKNYFIYFTFKQNMFFFVILFLIEVRE